MKDSAVKYIAADALEALRGVQEEAREMCRKYAILGNTTDPGIGLDMAVLREKADKATKLVAMLT